MAKIEFENKTSLRNSDLPEINKLTAGNINEIKASVNAIYDNPDTGWVTNIVQLDQAQIETMGSGIDIIPAPSEGMKYVFDTIAVRSLDGGGYDTGTSTFIWFRYAGIDILNISALILSQSQNTSIEHKCNSLYPTGDDYLYAPVVTDEAYNSPLQIRTWNNDNPSIGTRSIKIKVVYKEVNILF
jgi:hypothetical protein